MGFAEFIFGEKPSDVKLTDPALLDADRRRKLLESRWLEQLDGGQTAGEAAILEAGQAGAEQIDQGARSRARGARGFSRVAAESEAGEQASQGQAKLLGSVATQAGAQRAQDLAVAEQSLAGLSDQQIAQMQYEEELRKQRAKPGALGLITTAAGAATGAAIGGATGGWAGAAKGAETGAQVGGSAGTGIQQFGQRWI